MKLFNKKIILSAILASGVILQADWKTDAGDILQIAIPVSALAGTYVVDDKDGRSMLVKGFALNTVVVHTTKFSVEKWRPKGQNPESFPSGHTAAAFGGAAFIQTRYGYEYGIPAYALAGFVGYSRIISENHYADDVLAAASLAMMSNWAFTEPLVDDVTLSASQTKDGVKIALNFPIATKNQISEPPRQIKSINFDPDVRFIFEFGAVWMHKNEIKSSSPDGDTIDFDTYAGTADPTTSIRSGFEFYLDKKNEVFIQFSPYEMRVIGNLSRDTNFDGHTYLASTTDNTFMAYRWNEYRTRWRYKLIDNKDFLFKLGLGVSISDNEVELSELTGSQTTSTISSLVVLPIGHIHTGLKVGTQSELYAEIDAGAIANEYILDTTIQYKYKLSKHWDIAAGYRYQSMRIDSSGLYNHFSSDHVVMNLGYAFTY